MPTGDLVDQLDRLFADGPLARSAICSGLPACSQDGRKPRGTSARVLNSIRIFLPRQLHVSAHLMWPSVGCAAVSITRLYPIVGADNGHSFDREAIRTVAEPIVVLTFDAGVDLGNAQRLPVTVAPRPW